LDLPGLGYKPADGWSGCNSGCISREAQIHEVSWLCIYKAAPLMLFRSRYNCVVGITFLPRHHYLHLAVQGVGHCSVPKHSYVITCTQHNRQNGPSMWETLAHRRDKVQTHTAQQKERPVTVGYTSAQTGQCTDTHSTTGRTTRHCGIH
jgi:hypothetical protein